MRKTRSYVILTKVFLNPLSVSLKGFFIRVKKILEFKNKANKKHGELKN